MNQSIRSAKTIPDWLIEVVRDNSQKMAISSTDGRPSLTYQALLDLTQAIVVQLRSLGLEPGDIVAIALDNGADFLTSILSVASIATALPLNPNQPEAEIRRYFQQLDIKAVIIANNSKSAICAVADSLNILILELNVDVTAPAGQFRLSKTSSLVQSANIINTSKKISPKLSDYAVLVGTSGATGQPKIISLTHESFFVSINHAAEWMQLTQSDRSLVLTPLAMLHALVRSSCPLLLKGGEVVCTPGYNPAEILDWIDRYQPSFFTAVPSMYRSILQQVNEMNWTPKKSSLRFLVTGSDKIVASEIQAVESVFSVPLIQFYGMSEVSPLPAVRGLPPEITPDGAIGKINPLWQVACLDEELNLLLPEQEGEIVLRGGYINQLVGISQDRKSKSDDWFHTGDLGYLDSQGFLYFTGRVDNRINRGGKKIYAVDVESVLLTHPAIKAAVVFGIEDNLYGECIGAVVVLHSGHSATSESIRKFMLSQIAEFKVPDLILIEDTLPLNTFGKVKRKTLAAHFGLKNVLAYKKQAAINARTKYIAPRTQVERDLAQIWSNLLKVDFLSIEDNFFALGGHSLLAIQMLFCIQEVFAVDLPMHSLFYSPTVAELALKIECLQQSDRADFLPLKSVLATKIPLSLAQSKFWYRDRLEDTQAFSSMPRTLEIEGSLDIEIFDRSLQTIVERHAVLRTIIRSEDGIAYQQVDNNHKIELKLTDLQKISESKRKFVAYELLKQEAQKPFKLAEDYLLRFSLSRLSPVSYIFMVNMHHIISDGFSVEIFWQELALIYSSLIERKPNPLPPLPIQYADFVHWQQQWLKGDKAQENYKYWSKQLAELPTKMNLPFDRPRTSLRLFGKGKGVFLPIDETFAKQIRNFCSIRNVTLYMTFLAIWQLLLCYYSGQKEVVVNSVISGRDRFETQSLIGLFANSILLRTQCESDSTFEELIVQVRQTCLTAYAHQHISLQDIATQLEIKEDIRSLSRVSFSLNNYSQTGNSMPMSNLKTRRGEAIYNRFVVPDLQLIVKDIKNLLGVSLLYNSDLFKNSTATKILTKFQKLAIQVINHPEKTVEQLYASSLN